MTPTLSFNPDRTRKVHSLPIAALFCGLLFLHAAVHAQTTQTAPAPTHTFHDPAYHLSFDYPASWTFSNADGEISTFRLDARTAPKKSSLRAVVAMPENPFPASTFSGAYVYFSVTPHSSAASCARQAAPPTSTPGKPQPADSTRVNAIAFTRGHDEQKAICTTQRDEIYTTLHRGACLRFDLAINNFCGGDVSSVKDITPQELALVRARLEAILSTLRWDQR